MLGLPLHHGIAPAAARGLDSRGLRELVIFGPVPNDPRPASVNQLDARGRDRREPVPLLALADADPGSVRVPARLLGGVLGQPRRRPARREKPARRRAAALRPGLAPGRDGRVRTLIFRGGPPPACQAQATRFFPARSWTRKPSPWTTCCPSTPTGPRALAARGRPTADRRVLRQLGELRSRRPHRRTRAVGRRSHDRGNGRSPADSHGRASGQGRRRVPGRPGHRLRRGRPRRRAAVEAGGRGAGGAGLLRARWCLGPVVQPAQALRRPAGRPPARRFGPGADRRPTAGRLVGPGGCGNGRRYPRSHAPHGVRRRMATCSSTSSSPPGSACPNATWCWNRPVRPPTTTR